MTTRRYALRDDQWERLQVCSLDEGGSHSKGLFVEAVLYRYRAGIPWRDLPERFGHFRKVHTAFGAGQRRAYGNGCFRCCLKMQTTNTP
ncbi:hypothetical protein O77CONTIG1_02120 [Leptolyngbya sp. O-77]|nr:hypothetical protein O77CONTIG1_02120 [Leptolyngbya sp. O-77]